MAQQRCETTEWDRPCRNDAAFTVQGRYITLHPTCHEHAKTWRSFAHADAGFKITPIAE